MIDPTKPAFPPNPEVTGPTHYGLTKREYAAIHIAAGLASNPSVDLAAEELAADALLITNRLMTGLAHHG